MAHFSLASFNSRWGYDTANRPFDLTGACAALDADVIALQEVWEPDREAGAAHRAAQSLGYSYFEAPLSGSNVRAEPRITRRLHEIDGWWGLALLSRLPLSTVRTVDLGRRAGRIDLAHRQAIVAIIEVGGHQVDLTAVHLSFVPPNALVQLARLRRLVAHDGPQIVAGDFNLPRAVVGRSFAGWESAIRDATFPARRPRAQLDHVLAHGGATVSRARVLPHLGSDHLPVWAEIAVGDGPSPTQR